MKMARQKQAMRGFIGGFLFGTCVIFILVVLLAGCAINAFGSSSYPFATPRYTEWIAPQIRQGITRASNWLNQSQEARHARRRRMSHLRQTF